MILKKRKLFCEISPITYQVSVWKCSLLRCLHDALSKQVLAKTVAAHALPHKIYAHKSLIRRTLGTVDPVLQENKAINLALAAPKINGILLRPHETLSFWHLVGSCTARKGYKMGLTITKGAPSKDIGGGLCQFTNLLHWLTLHSSLTVVEHHHHDGMDLFPDFGRKVPFGVGTSVYHPYVDYRVKNETENTYQFMVWVDETHLCGELRAAQPQPSRYHVRVEQEHFTCEAETVYRNNEIWRKCIDVRTGNCLQDILYKRNHARVLYNTSGLEIQQK